MKDTSADQNVARIKREYLEYGKEVTRLRKPYEDAIKKDALKPLGPGSQALLDYINNSKGQIVIKNCIRAVRKKANRWHDDDWWKTRIQALASEGRIHATVYRNGDKVTTIYRKKTGARNLTRKELGPASHALLERINKESGVVHILEVIAWAKKKTGLKQNEYWWFRRIVALAIEGRIDHGVDRTLDIVHVYFQRKEGGQ